MVDVVDLVEEVVALDHNQCVRLPPGPAGVLENLLLNNFSDKFLRKKTLAHIFLPWFLLMVMIMTMTMTMMMMIMMMMMMMITMTMIMTMMTMMMMMMMSRYLASPTRIVSQSQLHHWASTSP